MILVTFPLQNDIMLVVGRASTPPETTPSKIFTTSVDAANVGIYQVGAAARMNLSMDSSTLDTVPASL